MAYVTLLFTAFLHDFKSDFKCAYACAALIVTSEYTPKVCPFSPPPALLKVTKIKMVFSTDDSLLKMLYLATMDITKKGQSPIELGSDILPVEYLLEEKLS
jgi:hypothetical protein